MPGFGIGHAARRREDDRFLTGAGRYLDDIRLPGEAHAWMLRSPHAHAVVRGLDTARAASAPGVLVILTGADYRAAGLGPLKSPVPVENKDGTPRADPSRWPLAIDRVRHVGDGVAMVVAETLAAAREAIELIEVDYEPLPVVADPARAPEPGQPLIWEEAPGNLCFDWETGDRASTDAAFDAAAHIVAIDLVNNRVSTNSMEMRGAIGDFADGRYTLYVSTQGAHMTRADLCEVLHIPEADMRVVVPDVGGGFGMKVFPYPEYPLVLWAARQLERPVRWVPDRSDSLISDCHGRDHHTHAELAVDADGVVVGMRVDTIANLGAYLSRFAPFLPTRVGPPLLTGSYTIPTIHVEVRGVFTNTVPIDAYRGAGRPEANYVIERLMDTAADQLGLDPLAVRRKNYISPDAMPYKTPLVYTYDGGDFAQNLGDALDLADRDGFAERRAAAARRGRRRGFGISTYVESSGAFPGEKAEASVRLGGDGQVTLLSGTQSIGQGQETVFVQMIEERLGIALGGVSFVQGDTDLIARGTSTGGSRGLIYGGHAVLSATESLIENATARAADMLEAAAVDIEYGAGAFRVVGTDRRVGLTEVAAHAEVNDEILEGDGSFEPEMGRSFPNGCHICEVEIDEETGVVEVVRYSVVDDFGTIVNPLLVRGQVRGGTVQGIGQALMEQCVYDGDGQLLTGSFMDYCMPRAADVPMLAVEFNEVVCANNPIGAKGCGEAGCTGSMPAVINALVDGLSDLGIRHIDMPATPERVWRAMRAATAH